jgi:hypothetical protein
VTRILATIFSLLLLGAAAAPAQNVLPCQVHVILFVPADVKPPSAYQQRIDEVVTYSETFFRRELGRWGHANPVMPFRRSPDGKVEVRLIRGKQRTADYKPVPLRAEVMDILRSENRIGERKQVWWILVYPGEPPARFNSFLGGYGVQIGGWAVGNLDTTPGRIDPAAPLGSEFLSKLMLKGIIHELGHGFELPHMGPLQRDAMGNTLMGPTHVFYRRQRPNGSPQVYLSAAEAAILSRHPAFRGVPDDRRAPGSVEVSDLTYSSAGNSLVVKGTLRSPQRAAYALVADESEANPGEYWTKTYVGKVAANGTFEVVVSEPAPASGTLKTWFVFENGFQTGDGKRRVKEGALAKRYTHNGGRWTFE